MIICKINLIGDSVMRIYKEGTFLVRFIIELIILLVIIPTLYLLTVIIFDKGFYWIELIVPIFVFTITSALSNYSKWWDSGKENDTMNEDDN